MDWSRTLSSPPDRETEERYGALLAELGREAHEHRFQVAPNPCVGAAVLGGGVELGRGFHTRWGGAHAEVRALEAARRKAPEAAPDTLVVTLEPCSSAGKTPPCTDALLAAGIARVVVGATDPDPRHRGAGLALLAQAGVEVLLVPGAAPLHEVAPYFSGWVDPDRARRRLPWTIAKWAQTRTGQLVLPEGAPGAEANGDEGLRWISSAPARAEVQRLRGRVDAIVTGIGTVRADDPRLTVRPPGDLARPPLRVVLDSHLRIDPGARLFHAPEDEAAERGGAVHVMALPGAAPIRHRALSAVGATVHAIRPADDGRLSLIEVQRTLWGLGVRRVLLEAGPELAEAYFAAELVDQITVYTAAVNGGQGASLAARLDPVGLVDGAHGEVGSDERFEAFLRRRR